MTEPQFEQLSKLIARDLVDHLNKSLELFSCTYGIEEANTCFAHGLAIAVGNILSGYSLANGHLNRKHLFKLFDLTLRASAKEHKEWKLKETH